MRERLFGGIGALALGLALATTTARADTLLEETVDFSGVFGFLGAGAPGFVIGAVKDGEMVVRGYGDRGDGKEPDGDTIMRIGSISKVFCGATLASLELDGALALTDTLESRAGFEGVTFPSRDGVPIRLIDLVTHSAGLPREVPAEPGPPDDPFAGNTHEAQVAGLADPLLFTPGRGILYSNYGFDLLGAALAHAGGKPYAELLSERILAPNGMTSTSFAPSPDQESRLMRGHDFGGQPMPFAPTPVTIECAGGLYSSADDMLRWLAWHLDRDGDRDRELRLRDHAAYRYRDGLSPVFGLDEGGGSMDALGLAWVVMLPEGDRPLILQKTGGLQGVFSYVAMAPDRGVAAFAAMNQFNVAGFPAMVETVVSLVSALARQ